MAIFIAQPEIVKQLGKISHHLYKVDRIEVGRRLDYSRWLNFVEIASSTRWSEIDRRVLAQIDRLQGIITKEQQVKIADLQPTDRLKSTVVGELVILLKNLLHKESDSSMAEEITNLLFDVCRANHFNEAKLQVEKSLPLFFIINKEYLENFLQSNFPKGNEKSRNSKFVNQVQMYIDWCLYISHERESDQPIFLFDENCFMLNGEEIRQLRDFVKFFSKRYQCIYGTSQLLDARDEKDIYQVELQELGGKCGNSSSSA